MVFQGVKQNLNKQFYINYEECKFVGDKMINRLIEGFILTMRNVNLSNKQGLYLPMPGFILTMRNGNDITFYLMSYPKFVLY